MLFLETLTKEQLRSSLVTWPDKIIQLKASPDVKVYVSNLEIGTNTGYWVTPKFTVSNLSNKAVVMMEFGPELKHHIEKMNGLIVERLKELFPGHDIRPLWRKEECLYMNLCHTWGNVAQLKLEFPDPKQNMHLYGLEAIKNTLDGMTICAVLTMKFPFITVKNNTVYMIPTLEGIFNCIPSTG